MMAILRAVGYLLRGLATVVIALLILFEEWGWEPLHQALMRLGRLPVMRQAEAFIARLPSYAALAIFLVPTLLLLPVKLAALWFIARGHALAGAVVIILAKIVGTAVVARLFTLTRPALMRLPWFARAYARWTVWKGEVFAQIRASAAWRAGRHAKAALLARWARWRSAP